MRVPYLDVCDDLEYSQVSKEKYDSAAVECGIPAMVCGGIYPGVSNLMAAKMIRDIRDTTQSSDTTDTDTAADVNKGEEDQIEVEKLLYSYFTAGSGGVGQTILVCHHISII